MSGGVDSSVAALLSVRKGDSCAGCTMKLYENEDAGVPREKGCCSLDDIEDARSVAFRLGMPYYVFNFTEDFREKVISRFVDAYESGRTPNPCIDCNRFLKFERLYERARTLGYDRIVTGHYARITEENGCFFLKKALDASKDQSYVLYALTQEQLQHTAFPLGELSKDEVRRIARENGFINADKKDSQDICFVPDGDYARVIELYTGRRSEPGDYVDKDGRVLGQHKGIIRYTVGQHKGLGYPFPEPMYVLKVDREKNQVVLGREEELFSKEAFVPRFHWISGEAPDAPFTASAKLRYRQKEQSCTVFPLEDGGVKLIFEEPQRAVTPGQAAVVYDGDTVLGGGELS
ncbi:MAG: tRNA 2-thiouridine(34) synthase MnmA [Lachnospiraceae bacterium]|nr:tRNA 2-thiouridine(34) synthase MnmA [Lachnospiraceae bacterium]